MLLSGFIFPVAAMPSILQWVSYLVPLTYFLTIVRGVIIKGVGFEDLWLQITLLTVLGLAVFTAAVLRFRKRID
jgi:ABC-2 type transport system permease protein